MGPTILVEGENIYFLKMANVDGVMVGVLYFCPSGTGSSPGKATIKTIGVTPFQPGVCIHIHTFMHR